MLNNLNCPINLIDYELYKSKSKEKYYYLPTFHNTSSRVVSDVKLAIYFGSLNDSPQEIDISFQKGLQPNETRALSKKIELDDSFDMQGIRIDFIRIIFQSGEAWDKSSTNSTDVNLIEISSPELVKFMEKHEGKDAKYFASKYEDIWGCICGKHNFNTLEHCEKCNRDKEFTLSNYSNEEEILNLIDRDIEKQRLANIEREMVKEKKKKSVMKFALLPLGILLISSFLIFGFLTNFTYSLENYHLLNAKDKNVALLGAVKDEKLSSVEFLLENGADATWVSLDGENAVIEALNSKNRDLIMLLLDSKTINIRDKGETLAHLAVENDDLDTLKQLNTLGFDMNIKNEEGETLLYRALKNDNTRIIKSLIEDLKVQLNDLDSKSNNIIQIAILFNPSEYKKIEPYLFLSIDYLEENTDGFNTYESLIKTQNIELVKSIVESNNFDLNNLNGDQNTGLHFYLINDLNDLNYFSGLVDLGAEVNKLNEDGQSPLYLAIKDERIDEIKVLKENGADLTNINSDGTTIKELVAGNSELSEIFFPLPVTIATTSTTSTTSTTKTENPSKENLLGLSEQELVNRLGNPTNNESYQGTNVFYYNDKTVFIDLYNGTVIKSCDISGTHYSTGISIGTAVSAIKEKWGQPDFEGDFEESSYIGYYYQQYLLDIYYSGNDTVISVCVSKNE